METGTRQGLHRAKQPDISALQVPWALGSRGSAPVNSRPGVGAGPTAKYCPPFGGGGAARGRYRQSTCTCLYHPVHAVSSLQIHLRLPSSFLWLATFTMAQLPRRGACASILPADAKGEEYGANVTQDVLNTHHKPVYHSSEAMVSFRIVPHSDQWLRWDDRDGARGFFSNTSMAIRGWRVPSAGGHH